MKPLAKVALHLAIGIAAFLLVPAVVRRGSADGPPAGQAPSHRPIEKSAAKPHGKRSVTAMKAADYQAAWDAVPSMGWDKDKRVEWQIRLLKEWAEVDLEGALAAAFAETTTRGF